MGLLTIGLLGFGTGGLNGNIRNIGTVGAKDIPVAQYQRGLRDQMQSFSGQLGRAVGFQEAQAIGLDQAVLAQLVTERTLDNEAATLGISIGDERVREELLLVPAFRGSTGAFDREAYRFTLQQVGLSEAEFETSVREEIARTMLQGAVVSGIPAPDAYASALSQFIGEARAITWAPVTASDLSSPPAAATDAQLQTYYSENPAAFTAPEARQISYVWLTPDMIQDQLDIDQTALQDLYQERISEFVQPERRLVERLIYLDTAAAQAAKDSLGDTVDFDALVAARGLAMSEVDMGDVTRDDLGANGDAIFSASPGDVIGPLDTFLGPALFRMNAVLASQTVTFEEAEPDLREELSSARARRLIDSSRAQIEDLLAGGAQLEDLAQQTDLAFGTITWTDQVQDDIAAYEEFRAAAAAITQDAYPSLLDLADGGIFALRLDDITPPALIPFEQVRDAVRAGYDAQVLQAAIVAQAQDIAATILPLTGFETLGLSANTQRAATRRSFINGTPADFMTQVFKMDVGDVNVIDTDAGAIIVRLDGIAAADANDPQVAAQKQAASDQAISGISQDIFEAFANAVQNRTDVVIDQAAVNAVNAQLQ